MHGLTADTRLVRPRQCVQRSLKLAEIRVDTEKRLNAIVGYCPNARTPERPATGQTPGWPVAVR
jgi:hypothetical protein